MDKGIRAYTRVYFAAQNAKRVAGEAFQGPKGNTAFRKEVMCKLQEQFGCSLPSAATHYNDVLIEVRKATPELVEGLGRPADKKGGRKPKAQQEAPAANLLDAMAASIPGDSHVFRPGQMPSIPFGWDKVEGGGELAVA